MRFAVRHETLYRYSVPVVLGPHLLRLTPRAETRIEERSLVVWPPPVDLRDGVDDHGNPVTRVTFSDRPTDQLRIDSRLALETFPGPPVVFDTAPPLPWSGPSSDGLAVYPSGAAGEDPRVVAFAQGLAAEAGYRPVAFLDHLCRTIHARADKQVRTTGEARGAAETLATWQGACRDLTVLFLAAARSLGMPARFCSGYQAAADTQDGGRYLHAWPEVFVPGAGWRGWDPTQGLAAAEGHVALCAAPEQAGTMPVVGGYAFSGASLTATLDFELRIATS